MPGSSFSILPKHVLLLLQHRLLPLLPTSVAEMACGRRCCEAGWGKVLKDTEDDCLGDGLLSRVGVACTGHIYLYLFKEIRVDLSPRVSF